MVEHTCFYFRDLNKAIMDMAGPSGLPPQACLFIEEGLLTSTGRRDSLAWEDVLGE